MEVTTSGRAEALISASPVKRTHYAIKLFIIITACLRDTAFKNHFMTLKEAEVPPIVLLHEVVKRLSNILSTVTGPF